MTMKPKAKRFRIRRSPATETAKPEAAPATPAAAPRAAAPQAQARPPAPDMQTDMDAIRQEGLTGRQLRMARRVAQKQGLAATSDYEAVSLLRQQGIDPFQRTNMLELVVPPAGAEPHEGGAPDAFSGLPPARTDRVQLPQRIEPKKQALPSTEVSPQQSRNREISEIQKDIAKRRRRKMALLSTRLAFFVMLPTLIAGWYFYVAATPMYATKSEFLILQADGAGGQALGGLLSGTQFATNQDAIAVQSYLQSKDAMLRLDSDVGFKSHFSQGWIDPIQRIATDASNESAYKTFKKNVKIGYDPTEGVVRMEVVAADPQIATEFSEHLIDYAEERVNELSQQKRGDQMAQAMEAFENAQAERRKAQEELVNLQVQGSLLDPEAAIASIRSQINSVELQLQEKELQLAALLDNARPNQSRVDGARGDVERLQALLAELNARMTDASQGENSLAALTVRLQMAQADLATRDLLLQSALQQVEQTRMEANRQVRYLTISVQPVASEEPSYPRAFENTVLAFLIFAGIYLMISLTASILREQVTT
ncbi:MAG: capsule biosynthesis protein [Rhodobacteraceae bacterium]|nr:capsule biosynthesis protein [Paracoccaceae bacterium]